MKTITEELKEVRDRLARLEGKPASELTKALHEIHHGLGIVRTMMDADPILSREYVDILRVSISMLLRTIPQ